ncbi:hypothetical protein AYI69_g10564 [Smittium culicis]|uniref:CCAAT-binding factor domain-containing protein n=1 Tax=Smittium culicis TaxID=133412 RepID=A0A1R1X4U9_9FUNG|nr:hypothetical protein AYI69_g10564 [Smittium culicis]
MSKPTTKRKRIQELTSDDEKQLKQIKEWELQINSDQKHFNNITLLVNLKTTNYQVKNAAHSSLTRVFSKLIDSDLVIIHKSINHVDDTENISPEDHKKILSNWLSKSYRAFTRNLLSCLYSIDDATQVNSLRLLHTLIQKEAAFLNRQSKTYKFPAHLYSEIVTVIVTRKNVSSNLISTFLDSYLCQYSDLRLSALKYIPNAITITDSIIKPSNSSKHSLDPSVLSKNTFLILSRIPFLEESSKVDQSFWVPVPKDISPKPGVLRTATYRKFYQESWISFMKLPLSADLYKQTLSLIHRRILPGIQAPFRLMDFLSVSYDSGGAISLLALNGLYTLISKYNLTYPDFYIKLYALFDKNLLHVKYRSRFLRLADTFLSSTHLPSYLVAAFIKRMARMCLFATPSAIAAIVPFIYNLLKRHPLCMVLIHRIDGENEDEITSTTESNQDDNTNKLESSFTDDLSTDAYNPTEPDPAKCNAINSSLWELLAIQNHYYANVSTVANIFNDPFTKPEFILEDFLDHSYSTMFVSETGRKLKNAPALSTPIPNSLFRSGEALTDIINF